MNNIKEATSSNKEKPLRYILRDYVQNKKYGATDAKIKKIQRSHVNIIFSAYHKIYIDIKVLFTRQPIH